jgi:hypothetical protein
MILVDGNPITSLPIDDPRRKWYDSEVKKIKAKNEPIVFKKPVLFKLSNGMRKNIPAVSIQSFGIISTDRGMENWGCCQTYEKTQTGRVILRPNSYFLNRSHHSLDPKKDFELIFFFTCVKNLAKHGYVIEDVEAESKKRNEAEIAELDVKYAIQRQLEPDQLRYYAKAWGVAAVDKLGVETLRAALFETVKRSHNNIAETKKGYAEFMDEILHADPTVIEARMHVQMAIDKGHLFIEPTSRHVKYGPNKQSLFIIPLEYVTRKVDYIADKLLEGKGKLSEIYETLVQDVTGEAKKFVISVAEVDKLDLRDDIVNVANKLGIKTTANMKDETIKEKILQKVQST